MEGGGRQAVIFGPWRVDVGNGAVLLHRSDPRFPKPLPIVREPVGKLFHLDPGHAHDIRLFGVGWVRVGDVGWGHDPGLRVENFKAKGGEEQSNGEGVRSSAYQLQSNWQIASFAAGLSRCERT